MIIGANVDKDGKGVHFKVWAPLSRSVRVVFRGKPGSDYPAPSPLKLDMKESGYFAGYSQQARAGHLYGFQLDNKERPLPDPASRYQPYGTADLSEIVDPTTFTWTDSGWRGIDQEKAVIYEMHIGTFTPEGTWAAAAQQLEEVASAGITVVEMMPVADFAGSFGWGYDGVFLFAPTRLYGAPDDLRRFVNCAHEVGLGVILDVVYNHVGAEDSIIADYSPYYFTDKYKNEWGTAINFDGEHAEQSRSFFIENARYWIEEFHFDGLRLDATQQLCDSSEKNIIAEISKAAKNAAPEKKVFIVAENEKQNSKLVRKMGVDALWNDDFHHSLRVLLTKHNEAFYSGYYGTAQEIVSAVKYGYLYQGEWYKWQNKRRGTQAFDLTHSQFVHYIENHDQISNACRGLRIHQLTSMAQFRAVSALLLLGPQIPLLFQGQEFAASSPFIFFADHKEPFKKMTDEGRRKFLCQFTSIKSIPPVIPNPSDAEAFTLCKLDFSERQKNAGIYTLYKDLLKVRRDDGVVLGTDRQSIDGAVLGDKIFLLRYFGSDQGNDRLLICNFTNDFMASSLPEPLSAAPEGKKWHLFWYSEDPSYGGCGVPPVLDNNEWYLSGDTAYFFTAAPCRSLSPWHPVCTF